MLVLDLSDNLLDQIFDGHQPVDPSELVDHHGDMGPRLAHLDEKVESRERRRDEQHFAQHRGQLRMLAFGSWPQHVLNVDEANHVVECSPIDGNSRMTLLYHTFNYLREGRLDVERDNIYAWHHHVSSRPVVDLEYVADEDALVRTERVGALGRRFLDHFVDRLAQALAVARPSDQPKKVAQTCERSTGLSLAAALGRLGIAHGKTVARSMCRLVFR